MGTASHPQPVVTLRSAGLTKAFLTGRSIVPIMPKSRYARRPSGILSRLPGKRVREHTLIPEYQLNHDREPYLDVDLHGSNQYPSFAPVNNEHQSELHQK